MLNQFYLCQMFSSSLKGQLSSMDERWIISASDNFISSLLVCTKRLIISNIFLKFFNPSCFRNDVHFWSPLLFLNNPNQSKLHGALSNRKKILFLCVLWKHRIKIVCLEIGKICTDHFWKSAQYHRDSVKLIYVRDVALPELKFEKYSIHNEISNNHL